MPFLTSKRARSSDSFWAVAVPEFKRIRIPKDNRKALKINLYFDIFIKKKP